jgi:hypothetical protein
MGTVEEDEYDRPRRITDQNRMKADTPVSKSRVTLP